VLTRLDFGHSELLRGGPSTRCPLEARRLPDARRTVARRAGALPTRRPQAAQCQLGRLSLAQCDL
jgi:hypothetical protein